jgi:hypothetical protein
VRVAGLAGRARRGRRFQEDLQRRVDAAVFRIVKELTPGPISDTPTGLLVD